MEDIRDVNGNVTHRVNGNEIRDIYGNVTHRINGNEVRDLSDSELAPIKYTKLSCYVA